jgi:hypothetical protein
MRRGFPRVYQSFADFEREELRKLDTLSTSIDDMLDDMFHEELNFDDSTVSRSRRREEAEDSD